MAWSLGLSQTGKLDAAARGVYRHALRTGAAAAADLAAGGADARQLQPARLPVRGDARLPDARQCRAARPRLWCGSGWRWTGGGLAGRGGAPMRESAGARISTRCWPTPLPQVPLDGALVEEAQRAFSRSAAGRARLFAHPPLRRRDAMPPWRPRRRAGAAGRAAVRARLRQAADRGHPRLLHGRRLPPACCCRRCRNATREVAGESWVLGTRAEIDPSSPQVQTLERDVIALYAADYAAQWDALLADLNVVPLRTLPQAVQDLYILASPQSPMRDLLAAVARQLTLSRRRRRRPPPGGGPCRRPPPRQRRPRGRQRPHRASARRSARRPVRRRSRRGSGGGRALQGAARPGRAPGPARRSTICWRC